MEWEAAHAANLDLYRWDTGAYPQDFKNRIIAWYGRHAELELHRQDAVARAALAASQQVTLLGGAIFGRLGQGRSAAAATGIRLGFCCGDAVARPALRAGDELIFTGSHGKRAFRLKTDA